MATVSGSAEAVLRDGRFCYVAADAKQGPHITPVVYVLDGHRLWLTTARGSVKARSWARDPMAGALVRHGDRAVTLRGRVSVYDAMDPATWPVSALRAPLLLRATARFSIKNVLYFAGYARDAPRVPLAWTPPGRILASIDLDHGAVLDLDRGRIVERWGTWGSRISPRTTFEVTPRRRMPDREAPGDLREVLGESGDGVIGLLGSAGHAVLPCRWARAAAEGAFYVVLPRRQLSLVSPKARGVGSLVIDRASHWRAAEMTGLLLRGEVEVFLPSRVRSRRAGLLSRAERAGPMPDDPAVLRLRPKEAVWWKGWSSGTVGRH
ncbi:MAG: pyridoxamine 5'-phosphate oxidase family protein [Actinomycetota bacterium]